MRASKLTEELSTIHAIESMTSPQPNQLFTSLIIENILRDVADVSRIIEAEFDGFSMDNV